MTTDHKLIVIVEDEADIARLVSLHLRKAGYAAEVCRDSRSFITSLDNRTPALVILDLMLPDMDGLEVCTQMKKDPRYASIPLVMLTARGEEADRVVGLEMGADDYIVKPFSPREMVARVKAVLRRKVATDTTGRITIGDSLVIDRDAHEVTSHGTPVDLTSTEFKLLTVLAENKGRVLARDRLLDLLWGPEKAVLDRTIDVHIKNLRDKLGPAGRLIKNIRGTGYTLRE